MEELDINVINVNTKQHARVILLNINRQSMEELSMNATSVNTNIHDSNINQSMKEFDINVNNVTVKLLCRVT